MSVYHNKYVDRIHSVTDQTTQEPNTFAAFNTGHLFRISTSIFFCFLFVLYQD